MLDHIGLAVADYTTSKAFFTAALAPLGITMKMEFQTAGGGAAGFGAADTPAFWIGGSPKPGTGTHVAFTAADRFLVDAFYQAAMAAGGTDNGPPGLRDYHPNYYGAFVLDPDGNNIEAVCHAPA
jgi:catechol 2,3-dioxygenase-like lactoylglutathione lyase family enzyme